MTKEERKLWYECLRDLPVRFHRQKMIGSYIVDFYCASHKLAIELDGSQHFEENGVEYDSCRSKYLNSLGITVLRYANYDVDTNFEGVCDDIRIKLGLM